MRRPKDRAKNRIARQRGTHRPAAAVQYCIHRNTLADTGTGIVLTGASPTAKANVYGVREICDL